MIRSKNYVRIYMEFISTIVYNDEKSKQKIQRFRRRKKTGVYAGLIVYTYTIYTYIYVYKTTN